MGGTILFIYTESIAGFIGFGGRKHQLNIIQRLQGGTEIINRAAPEFCYEWAWQTSGVALEGRVGACRPSLRRASVRFSENNVGRNSFLSDILKRALEGKEGSSSFSENALSETAGAKVPEKSGSRLNR